MFSLQALVDDGQGLFEVGSRNHRWESNGGSPQPGENSAMEATWRPHTQPGKVTSHSDLPGSAYAFPKQRKEPLTDASHVRNAMARFNQVEGVSDLDRELAFKNIQKAAEYYDVEMSEKSWRDFGKNERG